MTDEKNHLLFAVEDGVAVLTLNRPEKLNALSRDMIEQAVAALERCAADPAVGCVIVTGAERGFCAGGDIEAMKSADPDATFEQKVDRQRFGHRVPELLYMMPKITIAAVNGAAAGAGLGIALACDLRLASDRAKFTTAFARVGYSGDFGVTWPLTRLLGEAKAKELLLLPEVMSAEQALALGLVNRVVAHAQLMSTARELASRIARGPRIAYRHMKENVRLSSTLDYLALLDREAVSQRRTGETEDHREGVSAFLEKRAPDFPGT